MIPLKWAVGDRCEVTREGVLHVGVVESLGDGCACVKVGEWRKLFVGIDELELPLTERETLPAPPEEETTEDDELPAGAKGIGKQRRPGDPKKKYLKSRRPKAGDAEGWTDYRTQVRVAFNEAERDGATELMTWFREEHERAMAILEELKPGFASRFFTQGRVEAPPPDDTEDELDSFLTTNGDDDAQRIPGPHAERGGEGEGASDRGDVRRVPREATRALLGEPRDVAGANEARGGVVLREKGDGERSGEHRPEPLTEAPPVERKRRPTPALDRACAAIRELQRASLEGAWSPVRLRKEILAARNACKPVWRRAVLKVFGVGVLELPDARQTWLFDGAVAA